MRTVNTQETISDRRKRAKAEKPLADAIAKAANESLDERFARLSKWKVGDKVKWMEVGGWRHGEVVEVSNVQCWLVREIGKKRIRPFSYLLAEEEEVR